MSHVHVWLAARYQHERRLCLTYHTLASSPCYHERSRYQQLKHRPQVWTLLHSAGCNACKSSKFIVKAWPIGVYMWLLHEQLSGLNTQNPFRSFPALQTHMTHPIQIKDAPRLTQLKCSVMRNCPAQVLLPHRDDVKLESVSVSKNYLAAFERINGLQVRKI